MSIVLLGFTVPDDMAEQINHSDPAMMTQTHRFAWGLVSALEEAGAEVSLLSAAPVSDYPGNPNLLWRHTSFESGGRQGEMLPFVNLLGLKHITRRISASWYGRRHLKRARAEWMLVHGVHSPFLWFAASLKGRRGIRTCVVMTDPPGVVRQEDSWLRALLKTVDIWLATTALKRVDAVIVLAQPLAEDFAPHAPSLVLEGIYDAERWAPNSSTADRGQNASTSTSTFTFTYAGGLSTEYGVKNLVEAFMGLEFSKARLRLFGRGPLEGWIQEHAERDPRISGPELIGADQLAEIYASSDALVQPRPAAQGFVPYSFPSKLIEYMASGTLTLSTELPSIPQEYRPHVLWAGEGVTGMRNALERAVAMPNADRASLSQGAREFITTAKSSAAQGARIQSFLNQFT
jgi:glycosyltransferase involved in cell wall biosynthesis